MTRVLIIEDEEPAADRLKKMLLDIDSDLQIENVIVSISSSVKWLKENQPDLIFMDIHLADGSSFEIFKLVDVKTPVIFTTAFDQYAIDAFKVNSVDYLLKPLKKEELEVALQKFKTHFIKKENPSIDYQSVMDLLMREKGEYQKRILIRYADNIKAVEIKDVAYFYTEEKFNFLVMFDKVSYPIDYNLDELEKIIDPKVFFRINRQFIINYSAIEKMFSWTKSRVKLQLKPPSNIETIVSTERSPHFKEWLQGK